MSHRHTVSVAMLSAALAFGASGCGRDDEPGSDPSASPTTSTSTGESVEPTESAPDPDAWRSEYTTEQLAAYDRASATWDRYAQLTDRYERDPVDRETIQKVYEKYTHSAAALTDSYELSYIKGGVRTISPPNPLGRKVRKIEVNPKGGLVEFDQCYDYTTLDIRRNGKSIEGAAPTKNDTASVRIVMGSDASGNWRVVTSKVVDKPCT